MERQSDEESHSTVRLRQTIVTRAKYEGQSVFHLSADSARVLKRLSSLVSQTSASLLLGIRFEIQSSEDQNGERLIEAINPLEGKRLYYKDPLRKLKVEETLNKEAAD
jgi:hypothetical protein